MLTVGKASHAAGSKAAQSITVRDRFSCRNLDSSLLESCVRHTVAINDGNPIRHEIDRGPTWLIVTVYLTSPDGIEYAASFEPTSPTYFTMSTTAALESHRADLADDSRFFEEAARYDNLMAPA